MMTDTRTTLGAMAMGAIRHLVGFAVSGRSPEAQMQLASTPSGRIALHVLCAWRDHRYGWHWRGVAREFARA